MSEQQWDELERSQKRTAPEWERRWAAVRACKQRAEAEDRIAPTHEELTEALGDEIGAAAEYRERQARRPKRRRYDRRTYRERD